MEQELTELKEEIDSSTIILGDFNTLHTVMDRITRQKIRNTCIIKKSH